MADVIRINNTDLTPIESHGVRVITFDMMDEVHERPSGTARKNFNRNKHRLKDEMDYFVLKTDEATGLGIWAPNGLILLTERGYLKLSKTFRDDLAWELMDMLVNNYFSVVTPIQHTVSPRMLQIVELLMAEVADMRRELEHTRRLVHAAELTQEFLTIAQWVKREKVSRQIRRSDYQTLSLYIAACCTENGIAFHSGKGGAWPQNVRNKYPRNAYDKFVWPWLKRRQAQAHLQLVPTRSVAKED